MSVALGRQTYPRSPATSTNASNPARTSALKRSRSRSCPEMLTCVSGTRPTDHTIGSGVATACVPQRGQPFAGGAHHGCSHEWQLKRTGTAPLYVGARRCSTSISRMDADVAVLGGGPGGYTAAIRAAQLGAKAVCIEKEPELGGTCLRVGCIPTKAWVQTAFGIKEAEETFAKLGVRVGEPELDFAAANEWKAGVVHQMTSGVASLFKANGVEWVNGSGRFKDANTIAVEGGEDVSFKNAIIATGSFPLRPPIEGLDSQRCVDSTGLLAQTEVPARLVVLGGGIIGWEFASIFNRFGSEVTIVEMLPNLIPQEDEDATKELAKAFGKRGIRLELGKQCSRVDDHGHGLTVWFGDGETVDCELMLVAVGRG